MKWAAALCLGVALPSLIGNVNDRGRPVVRIELPGRDTGFLAVVDTGFNGQLFLAADDAGALGMPSTGLRSSAEVAGGVRQQVDEAIAVIMWMGRERRVEVLLDLDRQQPKRADDPIAPVGTRLLSSPMLLIDFTAGTVEIEGR